MTDNPHVVMTPTVARFARRSLFWVLITTIVALLALSSSILAASGGSSAPMSATDAGPAGAKALVEVLRHEGVEVTITSTLVETEAAVGDPARTTIFFYDQGFLLTIDQRKRLFDLAENIVLLDPAPDSLDFVSPDLAPAGFVDGTLSAGCGLAAAQAAGQITADGHGYRVLDDSLDAETCFGSGDDVYSLVQVAKDGVRYTALGATDALTNDAILDAGNAALGLNLLGSTEYLVWYLPGLEDYENDLATPAELSPDWVVPVSVVFFLTAIAAMIWRGRRLGPLVVENLPVSVRASETMRGRARLYEKADARLHTLDSLRIGTIARLAALCGLPGVATVDEVVLGVAAVSGLNQHEVRRLLVDEVPTGDRALVRLSDELLLLEQRVSDNLRPN